MTNYDKKRKRQTKGISESEKRGIYQEGFFAGQAQVIDQMTESGILPKVDFDLKSAYSSQKPRDHSSE